MMTLPSLEVADGERVLTSRGNRWLILVGRLKPETTIAQARARFDLLTRDMQAAHPEEWMSKHDGTGKVRESSSRSLPKVKLAFLRICNQPRRQCLALLFVIVNLVLLIACINLASMLLARAVARRKEIAVRLAVGASRVRIIRQLLTESVLLSLIAGVAGILLAVWLLNLRLPPCPSLPEGIRVAIDLRLDWRVVVYTITFSTITGILFGLAPALNSSKTDVSTVLKNDSSLFTGFYRKSRSRMALVVAQVAFSLLLLVIAGLVLRSLEKVRPTRLGFSSDNLVVAPVAVGRSEIRSIQESGVFPPTLRTRCRLPGVQAVSLADSVQGGLTGRLAAKY